MSARTIARDQNAQPKLNSDRDGLRVQGTPAQPESGPGPTGVYQAPWRPVVGNFVRIFTGWERIRAQIMTVPSGPGLKEFGCRLFAYQADGPWHWLRMDGRGRIWWPEGEA